MTKTRNCSRCGANAFLAALMGVVTLVGCPEEKDTYTGVRVDVRYDALALLEDLEVSGTVDGVQLFEPRVLAPEGGGVLAAGGESFVVLVDPSLDGAEVRLQVIGRIDGIPALAGQGTVRLEANTVVPLTVVLEEITGSCGDGVLDPIEGCDDGDLQPADGCDASCVVEIGWSCTGEPSVCVELTGCGNGVLDLGEDCDDGDLEPADGCDASCMVESGWSCTGEPSVCVEVSGCGNGIVDTGEECDDGDLDADDGCDGSCAVEIGWSCIGAPSVCTQLCGDGLCDTGVGESTETCAVDCGWRAVTVGMGFVCGLKSDNTAWCWGSGANGQLGSGSTANSPTPVQVSGVTNAVEIAAGLDHACVLLDNGEVWCWGTNLDGQLGTGSFGGSSDVPVEVVLINDGQHLAVGSAHSCVVRSDSSLWCWGLNSQGRLGDGSVDRRHTPVPATGLTAVASAGLHDHSCAVTTGAALYCWGVNADGQLGLGGSSPPHNTPQLVSAVSAAKSAALGVRFACVQTTAGDGLCWGDNEFGQLGDGSTEDRLIPVPVVFPGTLDGLAAGGRFVCGIRLSDGTVWCWGNNPLGQLGNGNTGGSSPTPVQALGLVGAIHVAARRTACAVQDDGTAWCWGEGVNGELGNGGLSNSDVPVAVSDPY